MEPILNQKCICQLRRFTILIYYTVFTLIKLISKHNILKIQLKYATLGITIKKKQLLKITINPT